MKTSEFIKRVERLGYEVDNISFPTVLRIVAGEDVWIASVETDALNKVDTRYDANIPSELFDLLVEYARTPIEERKDSKKYYLYNPIKDLYFNYKHEVGSYGWSTHGQTSVCQTQFTEEEIKNHRFRDMMELLEKEEVE